MTSACDPDFRRQLAGYSLATAEITYRMPDAQSLLQTYVWQDYDLAPGFPVLKKFLTFWERELDGPIHSVRLAHAELIRPAELRIVDAEYVLH
ncbi:MAG: usg protein [Pseudomonadota bacterium]